MPIVGQFGSPAGLGSMILPGGSFESIATVTLASSTADITISSIPNTYQHLQVRILMRSTYAATEVNASFWLNGDTNGLNYFWHTLTGQGVSVYSGNNSFSTQALLLQTVPAANSASGIFGALVVDILDYASTNKTKVLRSFGGNDRNGAGYVAATSNIWNSTAAINSFTLKSWDPSWAAGTQVALYGIKAP